MKKALLVLLSFGGMLAAQENLQWETATVRVVAEFSQDSMAYVKVMVCRGSRASCKEETIQTSVVDEALTRTMDTLGREGFEVVTVIPPRHENHNATVLLKRKRRAE